MLRTFTGTRAVAAGDSRRLKFYALHSVAGCTVNICDKDSGTVLWTEVIAANETRKQDFSHPYLAAPNGWHFEVTVGTLTRGVIDLV